MHRLRRVLASVTVVVAFVLAVPLVFTPPAVALPVAPPVDPVVVPAAEAGVPAVTGSAALEITGPQAAGLVAAGVGAFQGTCYVLGKLRSWGALNHTPMSDGSCGDGIHTIWNFFFGSSGDNRTVNQFGFSGVSSPGLPRTSNSSATFNVPSDQTVTTEWFETCVKDGHGFETARQVFVGFLTVGFSGDFGFNMSCGPTWPGYAERSSATMGGSETTAQQISNCSSWGLTCTVPSGTDNTLIGVRVYQCPKVATPRYFSGSVTPTDSASGGCTLQAAQTVDPTPGASWTTTTTVTCRKGSLTATYTAASQTFVPGANAQSPVGSSPTCDSILPGSHVDSTTATGGRTGVSPPEVQVTQPTFSPAATSAYPLCTTNAPAGGCFLDLKKNGVSCLAGSTYCAGWDTAANISRWAMTCEWGPYLMAISVCEQEYGTTFDTEVQPNPDPSSTVSPGGGAAPTQGTNPAEPDPSPVPKVAGQNCMGGLWSWNPVDWVLTPIKCALIWAFVPDTGQLAALEGQLQTALNGSGIGAWFAAVSNIFGGLGGTAGGCAGPEVTFPITDTHMHPFSACDAPMSTVAGISYAFTSLAVVVLGALAGLRALGVGFGFHIGLGERAKVSES